MPANFTTPLDELPGYPAWLAVVRAYARCQRLMSHELEALGLSVAQHEVLLTIARDEGLSQNDVAARLLVTKSNVTALLTRLENAGLVERRAHPTDARTRCVFLTPSGRRLGRRAVARQARVVSLMTRPLVDADLSALEDMMKAVEAELRTALDD